MPGSSTRRLILLRHAKSDRPAGIADLDRPLNPRGRRDAPIVGAYMEREGLRPDQVVVSPSLRTRETWEAVSQALGVSAVEIVEAIYEAPAKALLEVVRASEAGTLLLVGHNPGIQDLAMGLVGDGPADLRRRLSAEFPTAALAVIDFPAEAWARRGAGSIERFVRPRDISDDQAT